MDGRGAKALASEKNRDDARRCSEQTDGGHSWPCCCRVLHRPDKSHLPARSPARGLLCAGAVHNGSMSKKMLIDATHAEETRVVVVDGNKVEEFDFESENKYSGFLSTQI